MINRLIFFNPAGKGDTHFSRGFCNYAQRVLSPQKCIYYHNFHPDSFKDICEFDEKGAKKLGEHHDWRKQEEILRAAYERSETDSFVINTWVGVPEYGSAIEKGGITFEIHLEIYRRFFSETFSFDIPTDPNIYLPRINYPLFEIEKIQKVSKDLKKKNILIDNCSPKSGQSQHFDFGPVINKLAASYPEMNFFVLNPVADIKRENNIFFVGEIFDGPSNLNEFSYLSLFCDIIIGRTSGPWMHTIVAENIQDENKTFICFCKKEIESSYIKKSYLKANFLWKNTADLEEIYQTIDSEIKKQPLPLCNFTFLK